MSSCYLDGSITGGVPVPLSTGRAKCCLPQQTKVPTVTGGKFAIATKNLESLSDANAM